MALARRAVTTERHIQRKPIIRIRIRSTIIRIRTADTRILRIIRISSRKELVFPKHRNRFVMCCELERRREVGQLQFWSWQGRPLHPPPNRHPAHWHSALFLTLFHLNALLGKVKAQRKPIMRIRKRSTRIRRRTADTRTLRTTRRSSRKELVEAIVCIAFGAL